MKIFVSPLSRLEETVRLSGARRLISLFSDGAAAPLTAGLSEVDCLHLSFHDISGPREGFTPPSLEHVSRLLDFGRSWDRGAPLLVHCYAGISRSTAAAFVIACALMPDRDEAMIANELRRLAPSATPNPLVVAHADYLLGRHGRMSRAIDGIGRGAEAFEGEPFALDIG